MLVEEELGRALFDDPPLSNGHHAIHFCEYRPREVSGLQRRLGVSFV
jgi:hypothetical protein